MKKDITPKIHDLLVDFYIPKRPAWCKQNTFALTKIVSLINLENLPKPIISVSADQSHGAINLLWDFREKGVYIDADFSSEGDWLYYANIKGVEYFYGKGIKETGYLFPDQVVESLRFACMDSGDCKPEGCSFPRDAR